MSTPTIETRLTQALDSARNNADERPGGKIMLDLDVYQLLYFTAKNARDEIRARREA